MRKLNSNYIIVFIVIVAIFIYYRNRKKNNTVATNNNNFNDDNKNKLTYALTAYTNRNIEYQNMLQQHFNNSDEIRINNRLR